MAIGNLLISTGVKLYSEGKEDVVEFKLMRIGPTVDEIHSLRGVEISFDQTDERSTLLFSVPGSEKAQGKNIDFVMKKNITNSHQLLVCIRLLERACFISVT